jgi:nicotinamidase/pyrazinamidase
MSNHDKQVVLLTIDGQFDFCDPRGALYVPGADKSMNRLAKMVNRTKGDIDEIIATMDSHRTLHIAHPIWWVDKDGNHPITIPDGPPTVITVDDVTGSNPKWKATNPGYQKRSIEYVEKLATNGRYQLMIWPPHCLIGSNGHKIYPELFEAFCQWEEQFAAINYVTKGSNIFTEHYSAVKADVFDPEDAEGTGLNTNLIEMLQEPKIVLIGITGEANTHCVPNTVRDIANEFGEENIKKMVFIEDTSDSVPGCEALYDDFMEEMIERGMQVTTSDKFLK